jgi:protein-S-isoprenylcysteine O-methyltransferase Ste14
MSPSPAARVGDGLFTLGSVATLAGPASDLAGSVGRFAALDRPSVRVAGVVLIATGAAVALQAQADMGTAWRAGIDLDDDELVIDGLFSAVRNPFYSGMIAAAVGVCLIAANPVAMIGAAALVAGSEIDVRCVEEPHLRAAHGDQFDRYVASVPRFIPRLRRLARTRSVRSTENLTPGTTVSA